MNTINQTILVIEDSPIDDEKFRSILGGDHRLLFSAGDMDALEIDGNKDIDLVLLDINNPGVDAGQICSYFSDSPNYHNTPIIIIINKEEEHLLNQLPTGVSDWITKPLQPPLVMARVECHLKLKRYRDLWESPMVDSVRILDSLLAREWQRALRHQTPLSLILIDIDYFKEYEAHDGEFASDACLKSVGDALRSCAKRDVDFIAGHDTHAFICLLPETDTGGARRVCQKMQDKIAKLNIPHPCSPVADRVTVSIGVATVRPTFKLDKDYLRYQAEVSLQKSMDCGQNQVRIGEG
jgi:diguanylate cyclase (GGDEF)-like protein